MDIIHVHNNAEDNYCSSCVKQHKMSPACTNEELIIKMSVQNLWRATGSNVIAKSNCCVQNWKIKWCWLQDIESFYLDGRQRWFIAPRAAPSNIGHCKSQYHFTFSANIHCIYGLHIATLNLIKILLNEWSGRTIALVQLIIQKRRDMCWWRLFNIT